MKKISTIIVALIALVGFNACSSDDDVVFIAQPDADGIGFTNSFANTYTLTSATGENTAERFVWNEIDLEVPTNTTYELHGSTTENFENFTLLGTTSGNNLAVTVNQLLELAEEAGFDNDPATEAPNSGTLYFRVVGSAGTAGEMAHTTEVQPLTVVLPEATGEEEEETFRNFFLVGDVTAAGWEPANNNTPLFRDPDNPNVYYFTGRFAGNPDTEGFKLLETLGAWQPQWGLDGDQFTSSDILGGDPAAFPVEEDGYYSFQVNADEMTYSFDPYDASGAETYDAIGLVGDATPQGWDIDTPLTQSDFDPHIWYANDVTLTDGEWKLRANGAWDISWGGTNSFPSGQTTLNGGNMTASAGTYDVWFNDITGRFILIPQTAEE